MGQEIVYCFKCQTRLLGSDFERGKAFRVGSQVACPDCVRDLLVHLPDPDAELERLKQTAVRKAPGSTGSSARIPVIRPDSSARLRAIPRSVEPPPPPKSKLPLVLGLSGAAVLLVLVAVVAGGGSRSVPPPPPEEASLRPPPRPAPAPVPAPVPATAPVPSIARELDEIDAVTLPALKGGRLAEVARQLEAAKGRHSSPEWMRGVDARFQRLDQEARRLSAPFVEQAVAAARRRDAAAVAEARSRVSAFEVPSALEDLDRAVAAAEPAPPEPKPAPPKPAPPKPAPKPNPSAAEAYRAEWARAAALAASRNYAAAQAELAKIAAAQKDGAAKKEAEADLADLKLAAETVAELPRLLPRWTKGAKLRVEFIAEHGRLEGLEGVLQSVDAHGVVVAAESGTIEIPAGELAGSSVAALLALRGDKRPTDARAAALVAAFDGRGDGGLGGKYASVPGPGDGAEGSVRQLFWNAEERFGSTKTRSLAGEAYAELLEKHAGTAFVARNEAFLQARLAATRDAFFLPDELSGGGTFSPSGNSKVESFWISTADSPDAKTASNWVEAEIFVQPGQNYRGWVYAGGCCQEVFAFHLQGTGLSGPSSKNPRATVTAPPGGEEWIAVKPPTGGLKKKHGDHTGPKEPDKWDWVPLGPLKFAEPGLKKLRIVTGQKGLSIAYVVVSASRQGEPRDGEVKERLKSRPPPDPAPTGQVLREIWKGINGDDLDELLKSQKFRDGKPDEAGPISDLDSWNMGEHYGLRLRGYVHPPANGSYTFWIAGDDRYELWLSSDDTPARKQKIASKAGAVGQRDWNAGAKSDAVALAAGKRYYVEVLLKQGHGAEHVAVGWQLPDGTMERPIRSNRLSPYGLQTARRTPRPSFKPAPPEGPVVKSAHVGGKGGGDFEELPGPRAFLRGFKYSLAGSGALKSLQALYTGSPGGETEGAKHGGGGADQEVVAPPGYAVGGMVARGTDRLNRFKLVYYRLSGSRLVPSDRRESPWVGTREDGEDVVLDGEGRPVLGWHGRAGGEIDGAGLIFAEK